MNEKAIWISFSIAAVALFVIVFAFSYLFLTTDPNPQTAATAAQLETEVAFKLSATMNAIRTAQSTPVPSVVAPVATIASVEYVDYGEVSPEHAVFYVMSAGDTFAKIASAYGGNEQDLRELNLVDDYDWFYAGSIVRIRPESEGVAGVSFNSIPDAELVNSPNAANFDIAGFIQQQGGFLASYEEEIYGIEVEEEDDQDSNQTSQTITATPTLELTILTGAEIVEKVAVEYSINPRLLLSIIEYQTQWVTNPSPAPWTQTGTFSLGNSACQTFFCQLSWVADRLNWGYYAWKQNQISHLRTQDGQLIQIDPSLSAGSVALQTYFAFYHDYANWQTAVSQLGLAQTYQFFFGDPFTQGIQIAVPQGLSQPAWPLPFESGITWVFTGGPHPGWGNGTSLAALDFAPLGGTGCYDSDRWVVSISDGVIVGLAEGMVMVDVDGDGILQTGWTIQYMHIADAEETHTIGQVVHQGETIGHPSCEGGVSTGTHVHIARLFQGEWMDAGGTVPFVMDGWQAITAHGKYDGYLQKDQQILAPYLSGFEENENYLITRE